MKPAEKDLRYRIRMVLKKARNNLKFIFVYDLQEHENDLVYRLKEELLEDAVYECDEIRATLPKITVLSQEETFSMLKNYPKSIARFGDGEIRYLHGSGSLFQPYHPVLGEKLRKIISEKRDDLYVGVPYYFFHAPIGVSTFEKRCLRYNGTIHRRLLCSVCAEDPCYLDANAFIPYYKRTDSFDFADFYEREKELFAGRRIAVVAGEGILDKLQYDIFEKAAERIDISAPAKDAFAKYDEILEEIQRKADKGMLICMILGITATALAADLTDLGYMAWDLGHIAKDYNAFMTGEPKTVQNESRFWKPD